MTAKDVMSKKVLTVQADWPVTRLAEFLVGNGISGAPVISEDGALIGVVSMTDIVRHDSMPQRDPHAHRMHDYYVLSLENQYAEEEVASFRIEDDSQAKVRDIMTATLFRVRENTPLKDVAETMVKGRIHRVLVTRGDTVLGIVTALDMLTVFRTL